MSRVPRFPPHEDLDLDQLAELMNMILTDIGEVPVKVWRGTNIKRTCDAETAPQGSMVKAGAMALIQMGFPDHLILCQEHNTYALHQKCSGITARQAVLGKACYEV